MSVDSVEFRKALGSFVTGVTIVTTRAADGTDVGLTANSFNSVSLDPPMVLWSLAKTAASRAAFTQADCFAVHILAVDQEALSNRFAKRSENKFEGVELERGEGGLPLLRDCTARFECRTVHRYEGGDHIIFVGEVRSFVHSERRPLAFHSGRYAVAASKTTPADRQGRLGHEGGFGEDYFGYLLGRAHFQFYARVRPHVIRRSLSEAEHYVLGLLAIQDGQSVSELESIIAYTGVHVTPDVMDALAARGLIRLADDTGGARLWLTAEGRQLTIELTAVFKSIEAEVEGHFSHEEVRALKQLLKSLVNATDRGMPAPDAQ